MKDLTKIYIDLSKLSEEQIKGLAFVMQRTKKLHDKAFDFMSKGETFDRFICLAQTDSKEWTLWNLTAVFDKTEISYPEFIKLFEGGEEVRTELLPDVAYWRYRCLLAEKCLSVSPCDPDITNEQINAHKSYNQFLETFGNKD